MSIVCWCIITTYICIISMHVSVVLCSPPAVLAKWSLQGAPTRMKLHQGAFSCALPHKVVLCWIMSLHNHIAALSAIHQLSEIERTIGVKKVYGPDIKRVPRDLAGYPGAGRAQTCEPGIMQSSSPGFPSLLIVIRRRANWEPTFEYLHVHLLWEGVRGDGAIFL